MSLSHLRHNHHRYLLVADAVERLFGRIGFVGRSTAVMRLALESWADDEAIVRPEDRLAVRSALIQVGGLHESTIAAFSDAELVAGRLEHLAKPTTEKCALTRTLFASSVAVGVLAAASSVWAWLI